jgi:hypothetical protein
MTPRRCRDCPTPIRRPHARYCDACRWRHRGKPPRYDWTAERDQCLRARYDGRVKGRAAEVARSLGWPTWAIKKRAAQLGLCYPADRRDWTTEETRYLAEQAGSRTTHWLAQRLQRSEASVVLKLKRMRMSRRYREGYTLRELELCFGVDHHAIERLVREGKLQVRRRGTRRARDAWCVRDSDLVTFVRDHPTAFRLDRCDQVWFLDLITSGGLIRQALAAAVATERSA